MAEMGLPLFNLDKEILTSLKKTRKREQLAK